MCKEASAESSQAAAAEQETPLDHDVHMHFETVELDSVPETERKLGALLQSSLRLLERMYKSKQTLVQKL